MKKKFRLFTCICLLLGLLSVNFYGSAAEVSNPTKLTDEGREKLNASLAEKRSNQLKEINDLIEKDPRVFIKYKDSVDFSSARGKVASRINDKKYKRICVFNDIKAETIKFDTKETMYAVIDELKSDETVEYVVPDYIPIDLDSITVTTSDEPNYNKQWGLYNSGQTVNGITGTSCMDIGAPTGWSIYTNYSTITVGVIDTGIDISHPDLSGNIYTNSGEIAGDGIDNDSDGYIDDVHGWDFFNNDNTLYDTGEQAHGTHVAGIIAAQDNTIGIVGVAPKAKILPMKIVSSSGLITSGSAIINALAYAHAKGIKIVNCSWGIGYLDSNFTLSEIHTIIDSMTSTYSDTLYVCAAGNSATTVTSLIIPAGYSGYSNIITVGSVDSNGNLASTSNYGSNVTIAAPGENIYSTLPGSSYGFLSGTSMAAPFVTGIAALILANSSSLSASTMKTYIVTNRGRTLSQLSGLISSSKMATTVSASLLPVSQ